MSATCDHRGLALQFLNGCMKNLEEQPTKSAAGLVSIAISAVAEAYQHAELISETEAKEFQKHAAEKARAKPVDWEPPTKR